MSNDEEGGQHGRALYAYLARHWQAEGTNQNRWCDAHPGVQGPTLSRWARGVDPSIPMLFKVAEALQQPIAQILIAAEIVSRADLGVAIQAPPQTFAEALQSVADLCPRERALFAEMHQAFQDVAAGREGQVASGARHRGARRRSPTLD